MLQRNTNYIIFSFLMDFFCTLAAVALTIWLREHITLGEPLSPYGIRKLRSLFIEAGVVYPIIYTLFALYDPNRTFRLLIEYRIIIRASMVAGLTLAGLVYFTIRDISRLSMVYFFCIQFLLVVSWRGFYLLRRRPNEVNGVEIRRILLIGGGEASLRILRRLKELSWAGVHIIGYLTDGNQIPDHDQTIEYLGGLNEADKVIQRHQIDNVLIALPAESYESLQELIMELIDKPISIWIVPDYFNLLLYGSHVEDLGGLPMISLKSPTLTGYQRVIKRMFDLVLGMVSVIVSLPLMGIIAIAIKFDSHGPVIFKQQRVGENGRLFWMFKFRTMVTDADQRIGEVLRRDQNGRVVHKFENDPRITRFGRFLRNASLDELPQLLNVLKGDMSLVGPRPELPMWVAYYEPWQYKRFAVPQGITGWWQVNGRSDRPMHLHTEDDLYYIQNYSLFLDFQILLKTLWVVLNRKGAY